MFTFTNQQFAELQSHIDAVLSILNAARQQENNLLCDMSRAYPSRPMTKSELASLATITTRTLAKWLKPFRKQLREMGVPDHAKLLPPDAVHFICERLDITSDEKKRRRKLK